MKSCGTDTVNKYNIWKLKWEQEPQKDVISYDQRDNTMTKALSFHVADPNLISGIPHGLLSMSGIILECRARNYPWQ